MASRRKHFRFLGLPPELRNHIYSEAFKDEVPVHGSRRAKVRAPGILLACKEVYFEAVKLFYSTATFRFWEYEFGLEWYVRLPSIYRDAITKMRFELQAAQGPTTPRVIAGRLAKNQIVLFWDDVKKCGIQRRCEILAVRGVIHSCHTMPFNGEVLWDGRPPSVEMMPVPEGAHKEVWVTADLQGQEWKRLMKNRSKSI